MFINENTSGKTVFLKCALNFPLLWPTLLRLANLHMSGGALYWVTICVDFTCLHDTLTDAWIFGNLGQNYVIIIIILHIA